MVVSRKQPTMAAIQRVVVLNQRRRRSRSHVVRVNFFIRQNFSPFDILPEVAILKKFRLPRQQIIELLDLLRTALARPTCRSCALSPDVQLLAALWFFATGSFIEVVGEGYGLSKTSVWRCVYAVTDALLRHAGDWIRLPATCQEVQEVHQGCHTIAGIPRVLGLVDGTLIPLANPSVLDQAYISRKGYAAVNIQVVVDHRGVISDLVAKWPGSTHDSFVWANSAVGEQAERGAFGQSVFLGDSGYPLRRLNQEASLREKLIQLQCHFTWGLRKEDTDLSDLQNRLENDINFSSADQTGAKHLFSFLAFVKYLQDQPEEALANLTKAEDHIHEHNEECEKMLIVTYGDFAWLYYHLNDHVKSMKYLEKVEDIKRRFPTQSPTAFHAEVYGEMGWTFLMYSRKYHEKAKECFEKALMEHPDNPDWNCGYATALYRVEHESNTTEDSPAATQLRRALELSPGDSYIMALLGLKLADHGRLTEAEELIERALMISPDKPHVIRYVAKFFRKLGSMDKAIDLLKRALEKTPNSAFLHHQVAVCYRNKRFNLCKNGRQNISEEAEHHFRFAIHHYEKAIELKSSFIIAMTDLAALHAEKGNLTKAEELFQEAFQVARVKNLNLQDVHTSYGNFQLYKKRSESLAIEHYMKGCQIRKDNRAGELCVQKLEMIAKRRIDRNPSDGEAFGILGYVNQLRGDKLQAIECYEKALLHDPGNDEFLTALCDLRLSLH